jgi:hypothetical protein
MPWAQKDKGAELQLRSSVRQTLDALRITFRTQRLDGIAR